MFSQFVEAINQRASAVVEPVLETTKRSVSAQRAEAASPPRSTANNSLDPANTSYARRSKPSIEDRLRASLNREHVASASAAPINPSQIPLPLSPPLQASPDIEISPIDDSMELELPPKQAYDDPLTPMLLELEREQSAARARSIRSPPPKTQAPAPRVSSAVQPTFPINGDAFSRLPSQPDRTSLDSALHRLQAEWNIVDQLIRSLTPVESLSDIDALETYLKNTHHKADVSAEEIKLLNARIRQHDERMEELRDTHRLESASQSELIDSLREKLGEAEASLASERSKTTASNPESHAAEITSLTAEMEKSKVIAKDEEEKRVKAISLLKTVRTKLVKAEKDRDEAIKELTVLRDAERNVKQRADEDISKLSLEMERLRLEHAKENLRLKTQFETEVTALKDSLERELSTKRGQWEIELIASKASHQKELSILSSRLTQLEETSASLTSEKDRLFEDLQLSQAELESSQYQLEVVQGQVAELGFQLREATDRTSLLQQQLEDVKRVSAVSRSPLTNGDTAHSSSASAAEIARVLSESESRSEARLAELRARMNALELERAEAEEGWSRTLTLRGEELDKLRAMLKAKEQEFKEALDTKHERDEIINRLEEAVGKAKRDGDTERRKTQEALLELEMAKENLLSSSFDLKDLTSRLETANQLVDELRGKESQLKAGNKTLREELRKVQSSAALLERQRNPGVGYWGSPRVNGAENTATSSSTVDLTSRAHSNGTASPRSSVDSGRTENEKHQSSEEEVNLEYLRNVILQFLENQEMRPNLVRILSVILRFTPQETRRVLSKV